MSGEVVTVSLKEVQLLESINRTLSKMLIDKRIPVHIREEYGNKLESMMDNEPQPTH